MRYFISFSPASLKSGEIHHILGWRNAVNYWILAQQWWTGLEQEAPMSPPIFVFYLLL
jgi:hypothetical protein